MSSIGSFPRDCLPLRVHLRLGPPTNLRNEQHRQTPQAEPLCPHPAPYLLSDLSLDTGELPGTRLQASTHRAPTWLVPTARGVPRPQAPVPMHLRAADAPHRPPSGCPVSCMPTDSLRSPCLPSKHRLRFPVVRGMQRIPCHRAMASPLYSLQRTRTL